MDSLPTLIICKVLQKIGTRERCQMALVSREWLEVLNPESSLAWESVQVHLAELTNAFMYWMQNRADAIKEFELQPSWTHASRQDFHRVSHVLQFLAASASRLEALTIDVPRLHDGSMWDSLRPVHHLSMTESPLDSLYKSVQDITQLRRLQITSFVPVGPAKTLKSFSAMTNLTDLRLVQSRDSLLLEPKEYGQFWSAICSLTGLQTLSLAYCKADSFEAEGELPEAIGQLQDLRMLEIRECGLNNLPSTFSNLQKLQSFTFIESPQDCSMLSTLSSLTHLAILSESSPTCSCIPNLRELTVENTQKTAHLPRNSPLRTGLWSFLVDLDLSHLNLRKLPNAVSTMTTLKMLKLQHNALSSLATGTYLENLEQLNLAYNCFTAIPETLLSAQRLYRLNLKGNEDLGMTQESVELLKSLAGLMQVDLRKEFCNADDDFMDMDLCTGWGPASLKNLASLRSSAPAQLQILCNV